MSYLDNVTLHLNGGMKAQSEARALEADFASRIRAAMGTDSGEHPAGVMYQEITPTVVNSGRLHMEATQAVGIRHTLIYRTPLVYTPLPPTISRVMPRSEAIQRSPYRPGGSTRIINRFADGVKRLVGRR